MIVVNDRMKFCPACEKILSQGDFFVDRSRKGGRSFACRRCESKRRKEARDNDPEMAERQKARGREWYEKNKDKKQAQNKAWKDNNLSKFREINLKYRFGITLQDFENQLISQDYKCAICEIHADELDYNMVIDHCHATGSLRGLLCKKCNFALGLLDDKIENFEKAINYLKSCKI